MQGSSFHTRVISAVALVSLTVSTLASFGSPFSARTVAAQSTAPSRQQRLDRLEAGVRAEEGIRAAKRLQYSYSHYLEAGLWTDLADLFTENATGQFPNGTVTGKDNLRKRFMEQAERTQLGLAEGQLNSHLILQPIITLSADGKTIKGTWHEVAMMGKFGASASWRGGIYENEYALENGVWKISRLRYSQQYTGAYEEFGHRAPPKWDVPYHFEAAHVGLTIPESALNALAAPPSNVSAGARLAQLAGRIEKMNDETQVQNLQHSYAYYMDRKLYDDMTDLFTDDGSLEIAQRGVYVGKTRIRRAIETFYGPTPLVNGELFDHINVSTVVTVAADGQSASARTSQLSQLGRNGQYARWEEGVYENEFIKQNGVWKIKALHYYPRMSADYDKGWAKDAIPAATASAEFAPDRKPTEAYESYPKTHYVGFHYANPVTGRPVQYPSGPVTKTALVKQGAGASRTISDANIDATLAEMERKLDAAIGVDAVENLNSSYGYYLDESAWDQMADTFAITRGSKEITGAGVYVGRERIREVLNLRGPRGGRSATFFTIHQLTQPVIHISDDGQSDKARLRLFQCGGNADGSSGSWIGGIYENTAFKENGEWKFGAQDLHHTFNASYRNGCARFGAAGRGVARGNPPAATPPAAPAARGATRGGGIQQGIGGAAAPNRITSQMAPDRPIRSRQYVFPEIDEPAFHYRNPVTGRMPKQLLP
jgi:hypothetical protein